MSGGGVNFCLFFTFSFHFAFYAISYIKKKDFWEILNSEFRMVGGGGVVSIFF